jgi:hypothetical protein
MFHKDTGVSLSERRGLSVRAPRDKADQTVPVISCWHLILNKRATGGPQDLLDAEELEKD